VIEGMDIGRGMMTAQAAWDCAAVIASAATCIFTLTRRTMLSGQHGTWHSAPGLVQAVLAFQAILMGMVAMSILAGAHAGQRETVVYVVSALVSAVLVVNLTRTGRRDTSPDGEGSRP